MVIMKTFAIKKMAIQYTTEQKLALLLEVDKMGSQKKVSETFGVSRKMLRDWAVFLSVEMEAYRKQNGINPTARAKDMAVAINTRTQINHADFLHRSFQVKNEALAKMQKLIQTSASLKDVTQAVSLLHQITIQETGGEDNTQPAKDVYQQILNLQVNNYGKDNN